MNKSHKPLKKKKALCSHTVSKAFTAARKLNAMMLLLEQYNPTDEDLSYLDTEDITALLHFFKNATVRILKVAAKRGLKM